MVSAVHVCRRPLEWNGRTVLCGGIANVATHPDYRSRGLSGELLKMSVAHMEREGFDFSFLGTGLHGHYARYGWEQVDLPRYRVTPHGDARPGRLAPEPARHDAAVQAIYAHEARPLQLSRPERYFEKWVPCFWSKGTTEILLLAGRAYAVTRHGEEPDKPLEVVEWRAADADSEREILAEAAAHARTLGRTQVKFEGHPRHGGVAALEALGAVEADPDKWHMTRQIHLSDSDYAEVKRLYDSGAANWWPGDGF
jgi:predicted acetyltransferase